MVGDPERAFEKVKSLVELKGKNISLLGSNGDGQTTKVASQIIVSLAIKAVVAEVLLFASKAGADSGAFGPNGRLCFVADHGNSWRGYDPASDRARFPHWTDPRD
jgi:hypothetical protein